MARLREFVVPIEADASGFSATMRKAADTAAREARRIEGALEGVDSVLAGLGAGISLAGITAGIKAAIDYGDNLRDLARATGSTVEELAALDFMAKKSGASLDTVARATGVFQRQLGEVMAGGAKKAAAAIEALGLSAEQLAAAPLTDQLAVIAGQLEQVRSPAERAAIGAAIFGRSFQQLAPLLAEGEQGIRAMAARFDELGGAITGQAADGFDEFNDLLVDLETASRNAFTELASGLAPTLTRFLTGVAEAVPAARSGLADFFAGLAAGATDASASMDELDAKIAGTLARIFEGTKFGEQKARQAAEALRRVERLREEAATLRDFEPPPPREAPRFDRQPVTPLGKLKLGDDAGAKAADAERRREERERERLRQKDRSEFEQDVQAVRNYLQDISRAREEAFSRSQDALRREAQQAFEATRTPLEAYTIEVRRLLSLGLDQDTLSRAIGKAREELDRAREKAIETDDVMQDLGITFSSAFEDAIINGEKFSRVLQGIAQDIARIALREMVTEPLARAVKAIFAPKEGGGSAAGDFVSKLFGSIFGGFRAGGGPVMAGSAYVVGERGPEYFVPGVSGQIVPAGGGGGVTIINNTGMPIGGRDRGNVGGRRVIELGVLDALAGAVGTGAATRELGLAPGLTSR